MSTTWLIGPVLKPRLEWGAQHGSAIHKCPYCNIILLTGEHPGFCCGSCGSRLQDVPPLPDLLQEFDVFINDERISSLSQILNLIYSFASLESTAKFLTFYGPPGYFAVEGKLFHRV
ncbi:hypothetical protein K439DRAFT_1646264 [Ramaria rubella]|nr:hypothetical protein K439DRAFT_1646264 [Ramaria rubella]